MLWVLGFRTKTSGIAKSVTSGVVRQDRHVGVRTSSMRLRFQLGALPPQKIIHFLWPCISHDLINSSGTSILDLPGICHGTTPSTVSAEPVTILLTMFVFCCIILFCAPSTRSSRLLQFFPLVSSHHDVHYAFSNFFLFSNFSENPSTLVIIWDRVIMLMDMSQLCG